ncbi:MAG: MBL fold metallo-hydrolase [Candidatus Omnitrophica bacterium]|nr:MBL fold metallo-hydrolase [Candidatus Omnitrophota bacterium]
MKKHKISHHGLVKLQFLGGVRTVTGSSHLLTTPKSKILIDAGLFYGRREEFFEVNTTFAYQPQRINALILSHAHIDHCGNIPTLLKHGLHSKIYTTSATRDLCKLMLADSGRVQAEDFRYLRKIASRSKGRPRGRRRPEPVMIRGPLYTEHEAIRSISHFRPLHYGQKFKITNDVTLTFYDAGHILGASVVFLEIRMQHKVLRLGYAVDLGRKQLPLLNNPTILTGLDYLILESTYGGRLHTPISDAKGKLREAINRTVARKGKIIIPSFALERTQEVVYFISELLKEGSIAPIPIYVDSPLATRITEVFRSNVHYMDHEVKDLMRRDESPFDFLNLRYVQSQEESKALNNDKRPMIILAGSGMCEAGRVLHHLKNNITESRNTVLIVGYMARDTLGKKIVDKEKMVRIYGLEYELNAEVVVINALSGHADKNDLIEYVKESSPVNEVFLVHGDEDQTRCLYEALSAEGLNPYMPTKNEEIVLYEE